MPYVKPNTLLQLQIAANNAGIESYDNPYFDTDKLKGALSMCIVCGNATCDKTPVYVNGVYVHKEDAASADPVEVE